MKELWMLLAIVGGLIFLIHCSYRKDCERLHQLFGDGTCRMDTSYRTYLIKADGIRRELP